MALAFLQPRLTAVRDPQPARRHAMQEGRRLSPARFPDSRATDAAYNLNLTLMQCAVTLVRSPVSSVRACAAAEMSDVNACIRTSDGIDPPR